MKIATEALEMGRQQSSIGKVNLLGRITPASLTLPPTIKWAFSISSDASARYPFARINELEGDNISASFNSLRVSHSANKRTTTINSTAETVSELAECAGTR